MEALSTSVSQSHDPEAGLESSLITPEVSQTAHAPAVSVLSSGRSPMLILVGRSEELLELQAKHTHGRSHRYTRGQLREVSRQAVQCLSSDDVFLCAGECSRQPETRMRIHTARHRYYQLGARAGQILLKPANGENTPAFKGVLEELRTSESNPETANLRYAVKLTELRLGKYARHTNPTRYRNYRRAVCRRLEAEGPEGLERVLDRVQERIETDPETAIAMAKRALRSRVISKEDKELLKNITREAELIDNKARGYVVQRATAKLERKLVRQAEIEQRKTEAKAREKRDAAKGKWSAEYGLFPAASPSLTDRHKDEAAHNSAQPLCTVTFNLPDAVTGEMAVVQLGRILTELGSAASEKKEEKKREEEQREHRREMFQVARDMVLRLVGPARNGKEAAIMNSQTQIHFRNDLFVDEGEPLRVVDEILRARRRDAAAFTSPASRSLRVSPEHGPGRGIGRK